MFNWTHLTLIHGNDEGARAGFERACEMVLRAKFPDHEVRGIRVSQGDKGIDVYVGKFGQKNIDVYQCKYFTEKIGESQKQQIRDSYQKAVSASEFNVKNWFLCLPISLSIHETQWFEKWAKTCNKPVSLVPPLELMTWAESSGLTNLIFERDDSLKLDWIVSKLKQQNSDPWHALREQTESDCFQILLNLIRMHTNCLSGKYPHLEDSWQKVEKGDRLEASQYIKSVLVGDLKRNEKIWMLNMLNDFTLEPLAYKFIRRFDVLVEKSHQLGRHEELSFSEYFSTWNILRSPLISDLRKEAHWSIDFD